PLITFLPSVLRSVQRDSSTRLRALRLRVPARRRGRRASTSAPAPPRRHRRGPPCREATTRRTRGDQATLPARRRPRHRSPAVVRLADPTLTFAPPHARPPTWVPLPMRSVDGGRRAPSTHRRRRGLLAAPPREGAAASDDTGRDPSGGRR